MTKFLPFALLLNALFFFPFLASASAGDHAVIVRLVSSDQSVSQNTPTPVAYDTVDFDTDSEFDLGAERWTPTVPGFYQVSTTLGCLSGFPAAFYSCVSQIYKNGALISQGGAVLFGDLSQLVYMNGTTDYLEIYGANYGGVTSWSFNGSSSSGTQTTATFKYIPGVPSSTPGFIPSFTSGTLVGDFLLLGIFAVVFVKSFFV